MSFRASEAEIEGREPGGPAGGAAGGPIDRSRRRGPRVSPGSFRRAHALADWEERCAALFEDLRKPARVMIARAFGRALSADEVEDVYASAWTSTLAALRGREREMDDEELRAYLLTAVARHASKEMRRRSRKPVAALEDSHVQVLADAHEPGPAERAVGAESSSLARDVLASLPQRRRAVMLLRYGWGLEPKQVCGLVDGLSPRAYRKEITRGVEQMIDRLRQAESGEWCESREPVLRDYVAGTADAERRLQATEHISHCRSCSELVGRLESQLHDLGAALGWTAAVGSVGDAKLTIPERIGSVIDRGRDNVQGLTDAGERGAETLGAIGATGAGRGAGAAGAGLIAKLAGLGAAGKAAVACLGASAAATACVAAGVIPGAGAGEAGGPERDRKPGAHATESNLAATPSVDLIEATPPTEQSPAGGQTPIGRQDAAPTPVEQEQQPEIVTAPEGAPAQSPAPSAPATEQEFGLPAAATAGAGGGSGSGGGGVRSAGGGDVAREFGP